MAINFYTTGPALVVFDSVELGFCEDRVQIVVQPFFDDIHVDSWGGLAGPFADRQLLGAIAQINCLLTKFDDAAVQKLSAFVEQGNAVAGEVGDAKLGEFIYQDSKYATLEINGTTASSSLKFEYAHVANAFEFNSSMRHRRYQVQFLARMDSPCSRVLYEAGTDTSCFDD